MHRVMRIPDLDRAIRLDPHNADALRERARCYLLVLAPDEAFQDINEAIRLAPDDDEALCVRGQVFLTFKRNLPKALADLNRCIHLNPENVNALCSRAACSLRE